MAKGSKRRTGKIVTAGHTTKVEGLEALCDELAKWPEISTIRLGCIQTRNRVGRRSKKLKIDPDTDSGINTVHSIKRAHGGGGFEFKAHRDAVVGSIITGIKCSANNGTNTQEVVLTGSDRSAIWRKLLAHGLC